VTALVDLWELWDRVTCPTFVLHGADSPLLTLPVLERMRTTGPRPEVATLPGVGHAPALNTPEQVAIVADRLGVSTA
jgi:pimeloyl-ACP methyl ester carboxylesterase